MSKVIDFKTPAQMREELNARNEEIKVLKGKISNVNAVNEMLKLQIADLLDQLSVMSQQIELIRKNLLNLEGRLPQLD